MNELVPISRSQAVGSDAWGILVPAIIADAGDRAARRFLECFAATIRNKHTPMAYYQSGARGAWTKARGEAWQNAHAHARTGARPARQHRHLHRDVAGLRDSGKSPLLCSPIGRTGTLTENAM